MKSKKIIVAFILFCVFVMGTVSAYAYTNFENKINNLANLTGKTIEEIATRMENENKTFCQIAYEEGVLDEFIDSNKNTNTQYCNTKMKNEQGRQCQKMLNNNCQNINCIRNNCIYN